MGLLESLLTLSIASVYDILFWMIFERAGYPGRYCIVAHIPLVDLIALHYFAHTEWLIQKY